MTLEQAEAIFKSYKELLADESKRGARRSPALLPASKEIVVRAMRMLMAKLHFQGLDDEEGLRPLLHAAMFLDSFTHEAIDSLGFLDTMQQRRREMLAFYSELLNIPRNDPFYWQRVYALVGIACETKRTTFFEHIRQRLGMVQRKAVSVEGVNPTAQAPNRSA